MFSASWPSKAGHWSHFFISYNIYHRIHTRHHHPPTTSQLFLTFVLDNVNLSFGAGSSNHSEKLNEIIHSGFKVQTWTVWLSNLVCLEFHSGCQDQNMIPQNEFNFGCFDTESLGVQRRPRGSNKILAICFSLPPVIILT